MKGCEFGCPINGLLRFTVETKLGPHCEPPFLATVSLTVIFSKRALFPRKSHILVPKAVIFVRQ